MVGEIDEGGKSSTYNLSGTPANQVSSVSTISDVSSTGYMVGEIDEGGKSSTYNSQGPQLIR